MSRPISIVLVVLGLGATGFLAWTFLLRENMTQADQNGARPPAAREEEQRERRDNFFGGDADRDIRSGQEMRPQW